MMLISLSAKYCILTLSSNSKLVEAVVNRMNILASLFFVSMYPSSMLTARSRFVFNQLSWSLTVVIQQIFYSLINKNMISNYPNGSQDFVFCNPPLINVINMEFEPAKHRTLRTDLYSFSYNIYVHFSTFCIVCKVQIMISMVRYYVDYPHDVAPTVF